MSRDQRSLFLSLIKSSTPEQLAFIRRHLAHARDILIERGPICHPLTVGHIRSVWHRQLHDLEEAQAFMTAEAA